MTAAEARWRAERTQQLLAQGFGKLDALYQVRAEAKAQPWALPLNSYCRLLHKR